MLYIGLFQKKSSPPDGRHCFLTNLNFQNCLSPPPSPSEIFKLLLNLSLTHLGAEIACYELKEQLLSPVMLKEIFHDSLKISKFTRICMENHSSVTGWQKLFFSYKSF